MLCLKAIKYADISLIYKDIKKRGFIGEAPKER